jgi:UDP-GlcNAc:undecaprenyl-phosphate GlcNAc-1-phosphate transferase
MTYNIVLYGIISFLISVISVPLIIKLSHKHQVFDYSCSRKIHEGNIPRLGGLGIFLSCFPLSLFYLFNNNSSFNHIFLLSGMVTAFLVGFIDDLKPIRARYKLLMQIAAGCMVSASGLLIKDFVIYSFFTINFGYMAYPITVFWIIAFMNYVNLIDGMDGLSTGIVLLANLFIIIISIMTQNYLVLTLSLVLECSISGFYIFNFPPAKIFLGDGGAYFIGFMYAVLPLMGIKKSAALTVFLIPMILMLVPIFDVVQVMHNRLKNGHNIFHPDNRHLHHRLMNLGFTNKGILTVVYSYTVILGFFSLIMVVAKPEMTIFLLGFILMILAISVYILGKSEHVIMNLKKNDRYECETEENKKNVVLLKNKTG